MHLDMGFGNKWAKFFNINFFSPFLLICCLTFPHCVVSAYPCPFQALKDLHNTLHIRCGMYNVQPVVSSYTADPTAPPHTHTHWIFVGHVTPICPASSCRISDTNTTWFLGGVCMMLFPNESLNIFCHFLRNFRHR